MKFRMKDFRRFHTPAEIDIKPITFLLGENSAGKSSFLAGLRFILDTISIKAEGSFNREPFFMGAYDQIAHYRGGRFGRAKSFELGISFRGNEIEEIGGSQQSRYGFFLPVENPTNLVGNEAVNITFENEQSQPTISKIRVQNSNNRLMFERKTLPRFSYQDLTTRGASSSVLGSEQGDTVLRSGYNNRLNVQTFSDVANEWAFQSYRKARQQDGEIGDNRAAINIMQSSYGLLSLPANPVYAASPFRTKPERTYSPVEAISSPEGGHIPILLAQAKSFEKSKWNIIKDRLEDFGQRAGMFKKIDIKRLGKLDSDPFQLIITVSKDKSNIVDVGYGVSQILPIIVETIINPDALFYFFQQPEVHLHPRAQAELGSYFVSQSISTTKRFVIESHSDYMLDRIRTDLVSRGINPKDKLSILYFEKDDFETRIHSIGIDEDGSIVNPPENYREFFLQESLRTLGV